MNKNVLTKLEYYRKYPNNFKYYDMPLPLQNNKVYFSESWFLANLNEFNYIIKSYPNIKNILEIGTYEGRSALYLLENYSQASITIIDPFVNTGREYETKFNKKCYKIFKHNIKKYSSRVKLYVNYSNNILPKLINNSNSYDLIYIDGSHFPNQVIKDLINSDRLLKINGILMLDDYKYYAAYPDLLYTTPFPAIKIFFNKLGYKKYYKIIYIKYSIAFQKIAELDDNVKHDKKIKFYINLLNKNVKYDIKIYNKRIKYEEKINTSIDNYKN